LEVVRDHRFACPGSGGFAAPVLESLSKPFAICKNCYFHIL
jgi:hypothetical protein